MTGFLVSVAHAMGAPPGGAGAPQGAGGMFSAMLPLIIIFGIFYFLLIRPQQKKAKERQAMLDNLKKGDRIITSGGIYGTIYSLTPTTVTLIITESVKVKVARSFISGLASAEEEEKD